MIPRLTNIPILYCHSLLTSRGFTPFTSPSLTTTSAYPSSSSTVTPSSLPRTSSCQTTSSVHSSYYSPSSVMASLPSLTPSLHFPLLFLTSTLSFPSSSLSLSSSSLSPPPPLLTPWELLSLRQSTRS